jgi:hypothetical protein
MSITSAVEARIHAVVPVSIAIHFTRFVFALLLLVLKPFPEHEMIMTAIFASVQCRILSPVEWNLAESLVLSPALFSEFFL